MSSTFLKVIDIFIHQMYIHPMKTIPEKIKMVRESLRLTQNQFVALFNATEPKEVTLSQSLLSRYEAGTVIPPGDKFNKILELAP